MSATNHCGDCRLCCKVMAVPALEKPRSKWCSHICKIGCAIYEARPDECATYKCVWLDSQAREEGSPALPPELRPDKCHAVINIAKDGLTMVVDFDPTTNRIWTPSDAGKTPLGVFIARVSAYTTVLIRRGLHTRVVRRNTVIKEFMDNRPPRVSAGLEVMPE